MAELPYIEQLVVNNFNNYWKSNYIWNNTQAIVCENYILGIHEDCKIVKFLGIPE
jgi:hypothetical protein